MNFIRLPSLKLSNRDDGAHQDINNPAIDGSDNKITNSSGMFLPLAWKHHHEQPQPSLLQSPLGLRLEPYPQSYAQEMFSFTDSTPPLSKTRHSPGRRRRRTPHSYASMIAQAILTSKDQKMSLRDIYTWVQHKYPHLYETNETGWQNTIRHNLSLNRCFYKLPKAIQEKGRGKGKGGYWAVSLSQLNSTTFGRHLLDSGAISGFEYWNPDDSATASSSTPVDERGFDGFQTTASLTDDTELLPPNANLATLQQHQLHLQQRNVSLPPALSIPYDMSSTHPYNTTNDNPTFHPPLLHHILN